MPNKQIIELTFTDDHDQEVVTGFSVHDAYSVYELWVALPGNAGKSRADYIESLRGTQGKSIGGINTEVTELDPPKPEWVWLPAPDPTEDIKIGEVAQFTMTLSDANETVDPYPKATWVAKDKDDKLIDEGEVMPDSNGQYVVGLLHNGEREGKISVTFTVEGNASGSCYFIFGNEKVVRNYQWSDLSGRPDPVPFGETVKFTGVLKDLNNVPLPLPKVKFELINVMTMETVHTAEVPANTEFPGLYEVDILNDLEKADNHVGVFTAVDPNGETLKRADDIAVEFLSEQRALEWGEVITSNLDEPLLFDTWFNYRVELLGDDPRLAKVELHTGKSIDNIIRRVDCVRVEGEEHWWLGSLINNSSLEIYGQDREVIVAAIAYDASGNELTGYSPAVTVKLGNRPNWQWKNGISTNPIELAHGNSTVVDKLYIDQGNSGLPPAKIMLVIDGNDVNEVTLDDEGRATHTVVNENSTGDVVETSVEFRAGYDQWAEKTRVQLLPRDIPAVWGEVTHTELDKPLYYTGSVDYSAVLIDEGKKVSKVEVRVLNTAGEVVYSELVTQKSITPNLYEATIYNDESLSLLTESDNTVGRITMVGKDANDNVVLDNSTPFEVTFVKPAKWEFFNESADPETVPFGEYTNFSCSIRDVNNSGTDIPIVEFEFPNEVPRRVEADDGVYSRYVANPNHGGMPVVLSGRFMLYGGNPPQEVAGKEIPVTFRPDERGPVDPTDPGGGGIIDPF